MAHYPPPPQPDQQHYNALYPASAGAQQLIDAQEQQQLQYSNTPIYSKAEPARINHASQNHPIQHLAQELQLGDHQRQQMQHTAQDSQQHAIHGQHPNHSRPPHQGSDHGTPDQNQKANRLRKACDSCSIRKVKCDESGPPCRACASLDIPCTFDRPSRRRGPPNRHAEAIKRRRLDDSDFPVTPTPSSPTHAAQALAALSSHTSSAQLSAESICPLETIDLLIDDFFTYVHPLCPFPHEPSFRDAWRRREDVTNPSFLALLASMLGALISAFPRRPRKHLKAQGKAGLYPNHMSLVHKCQKVCAAARGPGYLESESLSVYDAVTSYFLALTGVYSFTWRIARVYFGECLTLIATLGLHKVKDHTYTGADLSSTSVGGHSGFESSTGVSVDNITLEIGRRLFWTMFVSFKSIHQLGAAFGELIIQPPLPHSIHPPLPSDVDDYCIYTTYNEPQPGGYIPLLTGVIANIDLYRSCDSLDRLEMAWGIDAVVDWEHQKRVLHESLQRCKDFIRRLPPELTVYADTHSSELGRQSNGSRFQIDLAHRGSSVQAIHEANQQDRRHLQYEIQKANICVSYLSTRSYIVDKYWALCKARERTTHSQDARMTQPNAREDDPVDQEMREERESIVKDLLTMLSTISEATMEPNAVYFAMKIRSIAGTLLDPHDHRHRPLAQEAEEYLSAFLEILARLERVNPINNDPDQPENEEAELRAWADLREYQLKFAEQGGLQGMS